MCPRSMHWVLDLQSVKSPRALALLSTLGPPPPLREHCRCLVQGLPLFLLDLRVQRFPDPTLGLPGLSASGLPRRRPVQGILVMQHHASETTQTWQWVHLAWQKICHVNQGQAFQRAPFHKAPGVVCRSTVYHLCPRALGVGTAQAQECVIRKAWCAHQCQRHVLGLWRTSMFPRVCTSRNSLVQDQRQPHPVFSLLCGN